ncbi:MAG: hypothetical protein EB127_05085 [Alphaproteobacteria bacterium]|nr:hypothetical protein [Alphaproteobacteria bacterium]
MGSYLATGIVQEIFVDKGGIKYPDITADKITDKLKEELNLDCYEFSEDLERYYWRIKPEILEKNLVEFLSIQFKMYQNKPSTHMLNAIDQLGKVAGGEEIIKLAKSRSLINFQSMPETIEYVRVIRDNGFDEHVTISYNLIAYFIDGKILTEGLSRSLRYFAANIGLQKDKYPIATCVKVMVTG